MRFTIVHLKAQIKFPLFSLKVVISQHPDLQGQHLRIWNGSWEVDDLGILENSAVFLLKPCKLGEVQIAENSVIHISVFHIVIKERYSVSAHCRINYAPAF